LREVIRKSMAKDPDGRYRSARELAEALKRARDAGAAPCLEPPATSKADAAAIPRLPDAPPAATAPQAPPRPPEARERARGRRWAWTLIAPPLVALGMWAGWRVLADFVTPSPQPSPTPATIATDAPPSPISTPTPSVTVSRGASSPPIAAGSCDEGNAAACTRLGVRYNTGQGVEKDVATAAEFYEKGCNGGDAQGCNNLGSLHEFGLIGIGPDPVRAAGLYRRACDRGDAQGCGNLGIVSLDDPGRRDEAIRLLREGCSKGASRPCRKLQELGLAP
jgi:TPR repeat protein